VRSLFLCPSSIIGGIPKDCFALASKVHHAAIERMSGVGELIISVYFNALRDP
jgi:hypothetical protein